MDAIDILGGLLGRRSKRPSPSPSPGGGGGDILKDIFGRGAQRPPQTRRDASPPDKSDIRREAEELEDLLNVSRDRNQSRTSQSPPSSSQWPPSGTGIPQPQAAPRRNEPDSGWPSPEPDRRQNDEALVLVRAMINAAKADGQVTPAEQQAILEQLGDRSPDTIQFLRQELARPVDVREFVYSVPQGMEQKVYAMSLLAIDGQSPASTKYLQELARGLRLSDQTCKQLEVRYGRG